VLLEKIPFFAIAIWFGIRAFEAQRLQGINPIDSKFSFVERISVAGNGITSYIIKHLYPYKLSAFYPYPEKIPVQFWIATIIIAIFSLFILYYLVKNLNQNPYNKFYLTGYLFFLLNIALVSQIIPVGKAVMADRYTYVSSIGILMMLGTALFHINEKMKGKKIILYTATGLWFSFLFINTRDQCKVWNSSISLWNNVIKYYPEADIAWLNRGLAKQNNNDLQGAISDYKKGIEVNPGLTLAWNNLGSVHSTLGKHKEALYFFDKAIQLDPTSANTFLNRANTKAALNDYEGAINDYDKYLEKVPDNSDILNDRALAHYHLKNYELAKVDFDKAIETGKKYNSSRLGIYYLNRGLCRAFLKDYEGAKSDYATALHIHPTPGLVYFNLGLLECYLGDFNKGSENLRTAEKMGIKDATKNLNSYCQGR
jgi:tetratricopeptide (TPR) repeat protein